VLLVVHLWSCSISNSILSNHDLLIVHIVKLHLLHGYVVLVCSLYLKSGSLSWVSSRLNSRCIGAYHAFDLLFETTLRWCILIITCLALVILVLLTRVVQNVAKHFVWWVKHPLLVWVLLQAADILSANVLVVNIISFWDVGAVVACGWNCSIWVVFCKTSSSVSRCSNTHKVAGVIGWSENTSVSRSTLRSWSCLIEPWLKTTQLFSKLESLLIIGCYSSNLLIWVLDLHLSGCKLLQILVLDQVILLKLSRQVVRIDNEAIVIDVDILHSLDVQDWPISTSSILWLLLLLLL